MSDTTVQGEVTSAAESAMQLVTRATKEGAASAREAAEKTWAATSLFACRFVYTTCYTISYGVVFPATLIACSIPKNNAAVRGLIDGASAARAKVDDIKAHGLSGSSSPAIANA